MRKSLKKKHSNA